MDYVPGVNTVTTFMGGWTSAVAKQYYLGQFLNSRCQVNASKTDERRHNRLWLDRGS
jgi:hypothetical protein